MVEKPQFQESGRESKDLSDAMVGDLEKKLLTEFSTIETITEGSPSMVVFDKGGHIVYVNFPFREMMGYSEAELISPNFNFMHIISPESVELAKTNFMYQFDEPEIEPCEYILVNKEGEKIAAMIRSKFIDYQGERATIGIVTAIKDLDQSEMASDTSDKNYRSLISKMCNGFVLNEIICNPEGIPIDSRFVEVNPAFENIAGIKAKDLIGKKAGDIFPGTESFWVNKCGEIALTGKATQFKNGSKLFGRYFEMIAYRPRRQHFAVVFTDITERMEMEAALRESECNFRAVAENADDGILIASEKGFYVYANRRASEITGYSIFEMIGMSYQNLTGPDQINSLCRIHENCLDGKFDSNPHETLIVKKDSSTVPVEVTSAKTLWKSQPATMVSIRDITLRKRLEEALVCLLAFISPRGPSAV